MTLRRALLLVLSLCFSAAAFAASPADAWPARMDAASNALKAGGYAEALRLSNRTIGEMIELLGPGEAATQVFGIVLTHKALAHAGLGQEDDALWYWQTVLSLYPKFAESDLSMFGAAGEFLKTHSERRLSAYVDPETMKTDAKVTPPRLKKRVMPSFPAGAQYFGVSGRLVVEVVITAQGRVLSPKVLQALPAPTLSYVALEAVKRWKFEPGRLDGEPVDVWFQLTVNYKP